MLRHIINKYRTIRQQDSEYWESREIDSENNPIENYTTLQSSSRLTLALVQMYADEDDFITEVGCNVGRHLKKLSTLGFNNLEGVEINSSCQDNALYDEISFCRASEYLKNKNPEIIYTHGNVICYLEMSAYNQIINDSTKYIILINERYKSAKFKIMMFFSDFKKIHYCKYGNKRRCVVYKNAHL